MKVEFELVNDVGDNIGSLTLEGRLMEPIVKELFDYIVAKVQSYYEEEAE